MPTYPTLDYLPDLSTSAMANALPLAFQPSHATSGATRWDNVATYTANSLTSNSIFRWTGTAGATYDFVSTSHFDPTSIRIYDSLGNAIAIDTEFVLDGPSTDTLHSFIAPYTGTYYVSAGWVQSQISPLATISIQENLSTVTAPIVDDHKNDTSTTSAIEPGHSLSGQIEVAYDTDWFSVTLAAGQSYTIDLISDTTAGLIDPYLSIYNSDGSPAAADDNSGQALNAQLTFTPTTTGKYYLSAASSPYNIPGVGGYKLSINTGTLALPDDYAANTTTTGTVPIGGQTSGNIETGGDSDWFRVALQAGTTYTFALRGADGNGGSLGTGTAEAYLTLYDAQGRFRTAAADGGSGGDPLITFTPTATDNYYLGVQDLFRQGTGTYTLSASVAAAPTDDFANNANTTGLVTPGSSVSGNIEVAGDTDWFGVTLTAGSSYTIKLDSASSRGLPDPYLRLYNSAGQLIASDDDSGLRLNALLTFTADTSGKYFLEASDGSIRGNQTGLYNLSVSSGTTIIDDYAANTLTKGVIVPGTSVSGTIETAHDNDWFAVHLDADTTYTINLNASGTSKLTDPYLRLYDSTGRPLAQDDDSGPGLNSQLTYAVKTTGTYFLGASGVGTSTGQYTLSITPIEIKQDDYAADASTTGRVTLDTPITGQIETPADHDWFSITLTAGTTYTIDLTRAANAGLNAPFLRLYNQNGALLALDDDSGTGLNAKLTYTPLSTGTYYIDASSASAFRGAVGNYNLAVYATAPAIDDYAADTSTTGRATVGGAVTGKIETAADHDWFSITLTAGTPYTIQLNASATEGLADPYLRLRDNLGQQIAADDDSGTGFNAQLTFTPPTTGTYYLDASSSGLQPQQTGKYELSVNTDTATQTPISTSDFNIDIRYSGDARYQSAFTHAAARWQSIITSDLPDMMNAQYGLIDDILITASITAIDGVNGVLGRASPTVLRPGTGLPYLGMMEFDSADMANMLASGTLEDVILHEMGHVLGIGSLWNYDNLVDLSNSSHYTGQYALSAWRTLSNNASANYVPLETTGGQGTAGVHWSETIFGDEIMTGYVDNHMPISIVTIGALADLGYTVNYAQADPYSLP